MPNDPESIMKCIQKSINLYISMALPGEDNEVKEQVIAPMAAVLLFNKDENFLYEVEAPYRDIFERNDADGYAREEADAKEVFQQQKASIVVSNKYSTEHRRLYQLIKFRVIDERRSIQQLQNDFSRLEKLANFLPDIQWSGILCGMICETPSQQIAQRKYDFEERTRRYAHSTTPNATGLRYLYLEPVLSMSKEWKWMIGACVVDFRGAEH